MRTVRGPRPVIRGKPKPTVSPSVRPQALALQMPPACGPSRLNHLHPPAADRANEQFVVLSRLIGVDEREPRDGPIELVGTAAIGRQSQRVAGAGMSLGQDAAADGCIFRIASVRGAASRRSAPCGRPTAGRESAARRWPSSPRAGRRPFASDVGLRQSCDLGWPGPTCWPR